MATELTGPALAAALKKINPGGTVASQKAELAKAPSVNPVPAPVQNYNPPDNRPGVVSGVANMSTPKPTAPVPTGQQTYSYIDKNNTNQYITASNPNEAIQNAPNIATNSGVMLEGADKQISGVEGQVGVGEEKKLGETTTPPTEGRTYGSNGVFTTLDGKTYTPNGRGGYTITGGTSTTTKTETTTPGTAEDTPDMIRKREIAEQALKDAEEGKKAMMDLQSGATPFTAAEQAQLNDLAAAYDAAIVKQGLFNKTTENSTMSNAYRMGAAEYSSSQAGILKAIVMEGAAKITGLQNEKASKLQALSQAIKDGNIKKIKDVYDGLAKAQERLGNELQDLITDTNNQIKNTTKTLNEMTSTEVSGLVNDPDMSVADKQKALSESTSHLTASQITTFSNIIQKQRKTELAAQKKAMEEGTSGGSSFNDIMQQAIDAGATPEQAAREAATVSEGMGISVDQKTLAKWVGISKGLKVTPATTGQEGTTAPTTALSPRQEMIEKAIMNLPSGYRGAKSIAPGKGKEKLRAQGFTETEISNSSQGNLGDRVSASVGDFFKDLF